VLAVGSLALWGAAPAAAAPAATDFEQRLSAVDRVEAKGGHGDEGPLTHRSGVITAPAEFDAVGLAGELRPLEIRVRPTGRAWSEWIEVGGGDPLYAVGGADQTQLRTHGWRPRGRLHYVDVTTPPNRRPATGKREPQRPSMISREGWGAEGACEPRTDPSYGRVRAVAVHHTVTSNSYSRSESRGIVLAICRYHRNGNGWNDIGYNALVDRFGRLFEGRAGGPFLPVIGAHAQGFNTQSAGISVIGDHSTVRPDDSAIAGLARYIAFRLDRLGFRAHGETTLTSGGGEANRYPAGTRVRVGRIFTHRTTGITACPGDALVARMNALRDKVKQRME
jgi:uncharacterized protein with LGFP repeats